MSLERPKHFREFDIVLVGATGFTGRLVASFLARRTQRTTSTAAVRVALAGRDAEKLQALAAELRRTYDAELPAVSIDLSQRASVTAIVARSRVVLTTAGPFGMYGNDLVAACAAAGTHYVDLSAEIPWIRSMILAHERTALASGACIVHCGGFDSVPSDIGVLLLREHMAACSLGVPDAVRTVIRRTRGGVSGGTIASMFNILERARREPEVRQALADEDCLCVGPGVVPGDGHVEPNEQRAPGRNGYLGVPRFDRRLQSWTVPYFMGAINSRVVRRSNALAGHPLGVDPDYRECFAFGGGPIGLLRAIFTAVAGALFVLLLLFPPTRWILRALVLPKPGQGPKSAVRGKGCFELTVHGYTGERKADEAGHVRVSSDRDPGYGATAIMIAECARLLARETPPAGFHTPASAFGGPLASALTDSGVRFDVSPVESAGNLSRRASVPPPAQQRTE